MRSGYVSIYYGHLWDTNLYGYDWSSIASSKRNDNTIMPNAYYLGFSATGITPSSDPTHRWYGFPLHCLKWL